MHKCTEKFSPNGPSTVASASLVINAGVKGWVSEMVLVETL